ncbi:hypothetical protein ACLOJK_019650 [Asimina triloba]
MGQQSRQARPASSSISSGSERPPISDPKSTPFAALPSAQPPNSIAAVNYTVSTGCNHPYKNPSSNEGWTHNPSSIKGALRGKGELPLQLTFGRKGLGDLGQVDPVGLGGSSSPVGPGGPVIKEETKAEIEKVVELEVASTMNSKNYQWGYESIYEEDPISAVEAQLTAWKEQLEMNAQWGYEEDALSAAAT